MTEFDDGLGALLRQWREAAGISQRALADLLGGDQAYISRLEGGQRHVTVQALLAYLGGIGSTLEQKAAEISALPGAEQHKSLWQSDEL